jgi:hypothetical protein
MRAAQALRAGINDTHPAPAEMPSVSPNLGER